MELAFRYAMNPIFVLEKLRKKLGTTSSRFDRFTPNQRASVAADAIDRGRRQQPEEPTSSLLFNPHHREAAVVALAQHRARHDKMMRTPTVV